MALWPKAIIIGLLAGPVVTGLVGTLVPAFGYLPALGSTEVSIAPFRAAFNAPGMLTSIGLSLGTGLAATALSLLIVILFTAGWLGAQIFSRISRFLAPLLAIPHAATAFALAFLIAPSGFLMRLFSPWATGFERPPDVLILNDPYGIAMTAGLVLKEVPFLFLMMLAALPQSRVLELTKVVTNLGYGRIKGFLCVVVPQIYPQIRLPIFAVLAYSTSVVDVAMILGPTTPPPLAPRILGWLFDPEPAIRFQASAAAILQIGVTGAAILVWVAGETVCKTLAEPMYRSGNRGPKDGLQRWLAVSFMTGSMIAVVGGFAVLGVWSFSDGWWFPELFPSAFGLDHWQSALKDNNGTILTTAVIAMVSAVPSLLLVVWLLEAHTRENAKPGPLLRGILFIPLLVPQVCFLFGLHVALVYLGLDGTWFAVALAHAVFVLPYVFLALTDPWDHLDPRFGRIAASLGASTQRIFWRIRLPLLLQPLLVALAIGLAVSVAQYLPTIVIGAGRVTTITTESLALASGGNRPALAVYALLQLVLPLFSFAVALMLPALVFRNRSAMRPASSF
ncbi:ABC transporter permease [Roseibium sediminis]|uniref:ABC transporter permease n=1 Tax=Roseibium sediminis TaxID=1775174 RepID=UPI00123D9688|nr:ABC transporter permease subunit [Roseibium sediminis]